MKISNKLSALIGGIIGLILPFVPGLSSISDASQKYLGLPWNFTFGILIPIAYTILLFILHPDTPSRDKIVNGLIFLVVYYLFSIISIIVYALFFFNPDPTVLKFL